MLESAAVMQPRKATPKIVPGYVNQFTATYDGGLKPCSERVGSAGLRRGRAHQMQVEDSRIGPAGTPLRRRPIEIPRGRDVEGIGSGRQARRAARRVERDGAAPKKKTREARRLAGVRNGIRTPRRLCSRTLARHRTSLDGLRDVPQAPRDADDPTMGMFRTGDSIARSELRIKQNCRQNHVPGSGPSSVRRPLRAGPPRRDCP